MMLLHEWLAGLKVGDEVIMEAFGSMRDTTVNVVTNATNNYVTVAGIRFRRQDGRRAGGESWSGYTLREPEPEMVAKIKDRAQRKKLRYELTEALNSGKLSTQVLRAMLDLVKAAMRLQEHREEGGV